MLSINLFRKKIKFYCSLSEVKERYPIIPAREYKYHWLRESALAFKQIVSEQSKYHQVSGTAKCGGISSIMQEGFIIKSWFDLTIKPLSQSNQFEYYIPEGIHSYLDEKKFNKKLITWFSNENPAHAIPALSGDLSTLIKINTPWVVSIPKGWKLLFMPIPYSDTPMFSATSGILEAGEKHDISIIIKLHTSTDEVFIPAGTPLCQFVPVCEKSAPVEFLDFTEHMKKLSSQSLYDRNHSFIIKYK